MPETGAPVYRHAPLADDKDIRILRVQADPRSGQPLCSFQCVSLDDPVEYIAISYSWGHDQRTVRTLARDDGGSLELSSTLSSLFDSLISRFGTFTVWIDALCINQHDSTEKGTQVGRMGQVYGKASKVIVWLGEGTEDSSVAFQFIAEQNTQPHHRDSESSFDSSDLARANAMETEYRTYHASLTSLWNLLERPWFRRVWVIQEATLGKNVSVLCGNDSIPFEYLERSLLSLWAAHGTEDMFDIKKPAYRALWCANRLFEIRDMYIASDSRGAVYERLLESTFHFLATDSRDFVFALQGLASNNDALLEPNYTDSTETIFQNAAAKLLCHGTSLDLLALAGTGRRDRYVDMPTWVPDFRQNPFSEPLWTSDKAGWRAGGKLQTQPALTTGSLLRIEAVKFDKIAVQGPIIVSFSFPTLRNSLSSLLSMGKDLDAYPTGESWRDVVWKTLIEGLDDQHKPVVPEFVEHFLSLRKLLGKVPWESSGESSEEEGEHPKSDEEVDAEICANLYLRTLGLHADGERTFTTTRGYLGMANSSVWVGDVVCLVPGCRVPLVLRPYSFIMPGATQDETPEIQYTVIGWSYVHGVMHGEGLKEDMTRETFIMK